MAHLGWASLGLAGQDWILQEHTRMGWARWGWAEVGQAGVEWADMGSNGLGWNLIGLAGK